MCRLRLDIGERLAVRLRFALDGPAPPLEPPWRPPPRGEYDLERDLE